MNFGLLLSQLPQVSQSRPHYDAMLSLEPRRHALVRMSVWVRERLVRRPAH